ncbi:MAG: chemotaxis protein CheA [Oscillospiraceae bacterium]|jgi:two-component system chemotaxis sensor kinase CheA|nr:chemotaxis protein CheA [Oscillospiraceae bacterium]
MKKIDTGLFLDDFESEAKAHIEKIEAAFLDPAAPTATPGFVNTVFRAVHSLKGTAGFFSLKKIVAVAHELENVFSQLKEGRLRLSDELTDAVLAGVDCLRVLVDNLTNDDAVDIDGVLALFRDYSAKPAPQPKDGEQAMTPGLVSPEVVQSLKDAARFGHKLYYIRVGYDRSLGKYYKHPEGIIANILSVGTIAALAVDGNITDVRERPAEQLVKALTALDTATLEFCSASVLEHELFSIAIEIDKKFIRHIPKETFHEGEAKPERPEQPAANIAPAERDFSLRLGISTINGLMDLANEMILTRNRLFSSVAENARHIAGLAPILHDVARLTNEMQEKVMQTRMQPVGTLFGKFPRIVRDTAKSLGKDVQVEIVGDDVMLDKYLLDALADPITQIVKNSVDHGIEPPARRKALGKSEKGTITLSALMRDGFAVMEISDDGAGIDVSALRKKALAAGIITQEKLDTMSDEESARLIFEPGISTATRVTNLSGRGVGMDIVKTNIERLGGRADISSFPGTGTTMRLQTPLSLSVIGALIVAANGIRYAVPETAVERIVRPGSHSHRLDTLNGSLVLSFDGGIIPAFTVEGIAAAALSRPAPYLAVPDTCKCVVLKASGRTFALVADSVLETIRTLIKPLPFFFKDCPIYSGVTVLGDGRAITILDAEGIARLMSLDAFAQEAPAVSAEGDGDGGHGRQALIFKCSGAEYYALWAENISRIEVISPRDIQQIGKARYVNVGGKTIRVVRPENYAPVQKRAHNAEKLYLITVNHSSAPLGFLSSKVLDLVTDSFHVETDRLKGDFVLGTGVYREKVLVFLDSRAIAEKAAGI